GRKGTVDNPNNGRNGHFILRKNQPDFSDPGKVFIQIVIDIDFKLAIFESSRSHFSNCLEIVVERIREAVTRNWKESCTSDFHSFLLFSMKNFRWIIIRL